MLLGPELVVDQKTTSKWERGRRRFGVHNENCLALVALVDVGVGVSLQQAWQLFEAIRRWCIQGGVGVVGCCISTG